MLLSEVCTIQSGLTIKSKLLPSGVGSRKVIRLNDIAEDGTIDLETLSEASLPDIPKRYEVQSGDLVFRSRGAYNVAAYIPRRTNVVAVPIMPVLILRPNRSVIRPDYLAWEINKLSSQRYFKRMVQGSTIRILPLSAVTNLKINVPDHDCQREIVRTVRLIERRAGLQRELDQLQRSHAELELSFIAESSVNSKI